MLPFHASGEIHITELTNLKATVRVLQCLCDTAQLPLVAVPVLGVSSSQMFLSLPKGRLVSIKQLPPDASSLLPEPGQHQFTFSVVPSLDTSHQ